MPQGRRRHKKESAGFKPWQRDDVRSLRDLSQPRESSPLRHTPPPRRLVLQREEAEAITAAGHVGAAEYSRIALESVLRQQPRLRITRLPDLGGLWVGGLRRRFKLWTPPPPKVVEKRLPREDAEPSRRDTSYKMTPIERELGVDYREQFAFAEHSLARWQDQQANPDDYEEETQQCYDCGTTLWFDVTTSGTVTTHCPRCKWTQAGSIYAAAARSVEGAFGVPRILLARRRFWSGADVGKLSVKPRKYVWQNHHRTFVSSEFVPDALYTPFSAKPSKSRFAEVIQFAQLGDPFVIPIPEGESPAKYQSAVRGALMGNKATMMGRWSVGRVKEGLRVGCIGTWRREIA